MMWPLVIFPDAEAWATEWLYDKLSESGYAWSDKLNFDVVIPRDEDRPQYLVVVNRDGGPVYEHEDHPRLRFNVWAPTDAECNEICRVITAYLLVARTDPGQPVVDVQVNGHNPVADRSGGARRVFWASLKTLAH